MKNLYRLMGRTTHKKHETLRFYWSSFGKLAIFSLFFLSNRSIGFSQCTSVVYYDNMETYTWFGDWYSYNYSNFYTNISVSPTVSAAHYGVGNGASLIEQDWYVLPNITGLNPAYTYKVKFRLASTLLFSTTAGTRGVDVGDFIEVQLSTNGGVSYSSEIRILGNSNAQWNYSATGVAAKTANGTLTQFTTPAGSQYALRPDGYSTVELTLPAGSTQCALDIYNRVNSAGEDFWIDNVELIEIIPQPTLSIAGNTPICSGGSLTLTASGAQTYSWNNGISNGVAFSPTASATYTVTGTNLGMVNGLGTQNSCTSTLSASITVNQPSVAPTSISGTTTICNGSSTTLTANGTLGTGAVYQWGTGSTVGTNAISGSTASITASPSSTTTYWVRIISTTSPCTATTSGVTAAVTVNQPSVAPTSISGTTTICNGSSTTLTANGTLGTGAVYQWGTGSTVGTNTISGSTASITVSPTSTTTYWVRIISTTSPCTATTNGVTTAVTVTPATVAPTFTAGATTLCANGTDIYSATTSQGTVSYSIVGGTGASINATTGVLSSAGTANFTIRATSTNGICSSLTTDRAVTVNPAPTLLSLTGSAVCSGLGTITSSTSQSGVNYQLYNSSNTAVGSVLAGTGSGLTWSGIAAGTGYYVIGTNATTSCNSTASNAVAITINAAPTVTANVTSTPICLGTTVTLTGGGATTYTWDNGVTDGVAFAPTATTTYTVTGTTAGCSNTASVLVTVNTPVVTASVVSGTAVWRGATSVDFGTASNWYAFDGTNYSVSSTPPSTSTNVIIPVSQGCVGLQPSTLGNSGSVNNITIEVGATLTMQNGTLVVNGNWINNGTFVSGTGTVQFAGSGNNTIGGSAANNFNNVEINKSGEAMLTSLASIAGSLTLTNGKLNIDGYTLNMGSQAIIGGSTTSYVKTSGAGELKRNLAVGTTTLFPIGRSTYNPVELVKSGSSHSFGVRVADAVTANGLDNGAVSTGKNMKRMWHITPAAGYSASNGPVSVSLIYENNVANFLNGYSDNPADRQMFHFGGTWENITSVTGTFATDVYAASNYFYCTQPGVTNFSPFTISNFGTALPIELISFQANCAGNKQVAVTWSTASEHNTSHFVVEKSRDGVNWTTLNTLGAAGNSTTVIDYALTDTDVANGITYYRLTQFDLDGASETFNIASVNCGEQAATSNLVTYPNPSNGSFYIDFYTQDLTGPSSISVFDSRGVIVYRQDVLVEKGSNVFHIEKMEAAPGMYYIQVSNGTTTSYIVKHSLR